MKKKTVRDIDVEGKTVLLRVDYNVPIKDGKVGDTLRIKASFDTINYLLEQRCRLVLVSHLGRPEGKPDPKYSLEPVAKVATELLGQEIFFLNQTVGEDVVRRVDALHSGQILLLENLRFHPEEEANDTEFANQLADLAEVYVDDAFAVIHRAHASTVGVAKLLPAAAGLLVEHEVDSIEAAIKNPKQPLLAVIGGAKVSTKIEVLQNLLGRVSTLLIGGAMANTFLAAQGHPIGRSKHEPDQLDTAKSILAKAGSSGIKIVLPTDVVVAKAIEKGAPAKTVKLPDVGPDDIIVDIGPGTIDAAFTPKPATIIWNGPLGITEIPAFAKSSQVLADKIIKSGASSIIGGGDTAAFVDAAGLHDKFTLVSTGGGASLELMAGKTLPGVEILPNK